MNLSPDDYHSPSNHAANEPFALYEIRLMRQASGFGFRIIGGKEEGTQVRNCIVYMSVVYHSDK